MAIGGIGPGATDYYYRRLISTFAEKNATASVASFALICVSISTLPATQIPAPNQAINAATLTKQPKLNTASDYFSRGYAWHQKQDYDRAISDYTEAIKLAPKYARAFINRGAAWQRKHQLDRAMSDYNKGITLEPRDPVAFLNRGNAWSDKHNYDRAIDDFNQAIKLKSNYAIAFNNRGNSWSAKHNYDRAISDYTDAINFHPIYPGAFYNRGRTYVRKNDKQHAIADFQQAYDLSGPNDPCRKNALAELQKLGVNPPSSSSAPTLIRA